MDKDKKDLILDMKLHDDDKYFFQGRKINGVVDLIKNIKLNDVQL